MGRAARTGDLPVVNSMYESTVRNPEFMGFGAENPKRHDFSYSFLVLLSQKVAAVVETNHVFGEIHFSACEGLRWVCHDQVTRRRGFRRMSRV